MILMDCNFEVVFLRHRNEEHDNFWCRGSTFDFVDKVLMISIVLVAEESSEEKGIYGIGAHCDWGFLTLLATDNVPGLQVFA